MAHLSKRFATLTSNVRSSNGLLPDGFTFFPRFFDTHERQLLLTAALSQLDATENIRVRRLQIDYRARNTISDSDPDEHLFLPDCCYSFHEVGTQSTTPLCFQVSTDHSNFPKGHYDNVIRDYREMRLTSWPESEFRGLTPVLDRLRALYPSKNTQTHLLHLASSGEILPHIDNISASGKWILGVSLGSTRILRMESPTSAVSERFDIPLPSGSVYLQR
ncbi:hypothetical protein JVT61DRAFT_9615 [Boletus reticuloceps]|uniref:Alpha-ketoglutarate-dependent dioxygenase AlkB-like domain-containing protein n=1 Tax=Boletus reticuloceps TaxID=495285 RepID=A0A8I2YHE0_9AGAM|nr:hypothetical protein JVT61DRAFT_9615 [Boletus reticuloceps]